MSADKTDPLGSHQARRRPDDKSPNAPRESFGSGLGDAGSGVGSELQLEILSGSQRGTRRTFSGPEVLIGRRPRNHIVLDGPEDKIVSGYHLWIKLNDFEWWVEDRGSTNGTLVNGARIDTPTKLRHGDLIELGRRRRSDSEGTIRIRVHTETASIDPLDSDPITVDGEDEFMTEALAPEIALEWIGRDGAPCPADKLPPPNSKSPATSAEVRHAAPESPARPASESGSTECGSTSMTVSARKPPVPDSRPTGHIDPAPPPQQQRAGAAAMTGRGASAQPVDARSVHTAGDEQERIQEVHRKSVRFGQVSGRLEGLVEGLAKGCLDEPTGVDLAQTEGGPALLALVRGREESEAELFEVENSLPKLRARMDEELAPLDDSVSKKTAVADAARAALGTAERQAADLDALLATQLSEARGALSMQLDRFMRDLASASKPNEELGTPWSSWIQDLSQSLVEAERRAPDLDAQWELLRSARQDLERLSNEATLAAGELDSARRKARTHRAELQAKLAELESRLIGARAQATLALARLEAGSRAFVEQHFALSDSPLRALPNFESASTLWRERESLKSDLAALHPGLF